MIGDTKLLIIRQLPVVDYAVEFVKVLRESGIVGHRGAFPGGRRIPGTLKEAKSLREDVVSDIVEAPDGFRPKLALYADDIFRFLKSYFAVGSIGNLFDVSVVVPAYAAVHAVREEGEGPALIHKTGPAVTPFQFAVVVGQIQIGVGGR